MKNNIMIAILSIACFTGCGYRGNPTPITAVDANTHPCQAVIENGVANSSQLAWDEAKHAWVFLTSDEMKERARKYWQTAKESAVKAYDKMIESYDEHK